MLTRLVSLLLVLFASLATAEAQPSGHQPAEHAAVIAVLDEYMKAISANDLKAMASMQTPDGMTYRARVEKGKPAAITGRSNAAWVAPERAGGPPLRERYWSPTVLIRGPIAVVWAPYEFQVDGKTTHCGIDVFDFLKMDGRWVVSNAMWTVEPDGCEDLRHPGASGLRPPL
jgi:hypothetical protein